jgi:hypothetical protein
MILNFNIVYFRSNVYFPRATSSGYLTVLAKKETKSVLGTIKTNGAGSVESNIRSQIATHSCLVCNKLKHEALFVIMFFLMLGIGGILIRIWILGSVPGTSDQKNTDPTVPDPDADQEHW